MRETALSGVMGALQEFEFLVQTNGEARQTGIERMEGTDRNGRLLRERKEWRRMMEEIESDNSGLRGLKGTKGS